MAQKPTLIVQSTPYGRYRNLGPLKNYGSTCTASMHYCFSYDSDLRLIELCRNDSPHRITQFNSLYDLIE